MTNARRVQPAGCHSHGTARWGGLGPVPEVVTTYVAPLDRGRRGLRGCVCVCVCCNSQVNDCSASVLGS